MAQEDSIPVITDTQNNEATSFIAAGQGGSGVDSTYSDFFQETSDGTISVGPKAQKSGLEIFTNISGYLVPLVILGAVISGFHLYIQSGGGAQAIKENYTFLCSYLNYGITDVGEEYSCATIDTIKDAYTQKKTELDSAIVERLNEYIPIKLTKNILIASPERAFTIQQFDTKIHMDEILKQFDIVQAESQSKKRDNISCNGVSILAGGNLTTQCTIYGDVSGSDDENGKLGSARIEALRFASNLGDTSKSQFILLNPPTSLSMEKLDDGDDSGFATRTTLSIQALYVPFKDNNTKF